MSLPNAISPLKQAAKRVFEFQHYRVLSHPAEKFKAMTDAVTVKMLHRIAAGKHDCTICRRTLSLKTGGSSPGIIGYMHGGFDADISAVCVCACVACTLELGDHEAARTICQDFADEVCGSGEVSFVEGGTA
jgi:hypothetical protein